MSEGSTGWRAEPSSLAVSLGELLPELEARLHRRTTERLAARILASEPGTLTAVELAQELVRNAGSQVAAYGHVMDLASELSVSYRSAGTDAERRDVLASFIRSQTPDAVQVRGDLRALSRWFDIEAAEGRLARRAADHVDEIQVAYACLATLAQREIPPQDLGSLHPAQVLDAALMHVDLCPHWAVQLAALEAVRSVAELLPPEERAADVGARHLTRLRGWASGSDVNHWVQVKAMRTLATVRPAAFEELSAALLSSQDGPYATVIRANALTVFSEALEPTTVRIRLLLERKADPSEHVRQVLARQLARLNTDETIAELRGLVASDDSERVRGVALQELAHACISDERIGPVAEAVCRTLQNDLSELVVRVAIECVAEALRASQPLPPLPICRSLAYALGRDDLSAGVRARIAVALRLVEVDSAQSLRELRDGFSAVLGRLGAGKTTRVKVDPRYRLPDVERGFAVAAHGNLAVSLVPRSPGRYFITRGERRGFRLWRFLHELVTPAPDKRAGYLHSHARTAARVATVVPPNLLAEVTATRVPGERRLTPRVGGWGEFVPRVDDLLAVTGMLPGTRRLVTTMGTVVVSGPRGFFQRVLTWFIVTLRYAKLSRQRQRSLEASDAEGQLSFARSCERLGFRFEVGETGGEIAGERFDLGSRAMPRYLAPGVFFAPSWFSDWTAYLISPSGNTPWHLAIVAWVVFALVAIRAAWSMRRIEINRSGIPLTIGGWGTRGKSGTERLKAALFHALRYDVAVKTTGCEAMLIFAQRDRQAHELFLYRPYDKATIWEQSEVLTASHRLGAQVFLWECMALKPEFASVLAHSWMRDSIVTLTNAYPDHEDIMGPSGEDVAQVIGSFMPRGGINFTAEEQMLPILQESARNHDAKLVPVSPLAGELLPRDLMDRFPYSAHPTNVALVLAMAEHLGIDHERALIDMADNVVPDLGVLKTYPTVMHEGRRLTFSNGMSANERAGFLSNWTRLGFDGHDVETEPGTTTVIVVNNRDDRVARSRIFAEILTRDISVDHVVLIGTNLPAMRGFMASALETWLSSMEIDPALGSERAGEIIANAVRRLRVPQTEAAVVAKLHSMLFAAGVPTEIAQRCAQQASQSVFADPESDVAEVLAEVGSEAIDLSEVQEHAARLSRQVRRARSGRAAVLEAVAGGDRGRAESELRGLYRELFLERIHILADPGTTGDQVIDAVARIVPPGHHCNLLGAQNIKGTGLDFAYRWVSIGQVRAALDRLDTEPAARQETLKWLLSHTDYGLIDCREARDRARQLLGGEGSEWAQHRTLLEAAVGRLEEMETVLSKKLQEKTRRTFADSVLGVIEEVFDHMDSVRRRNRADAVMQDLFNERIGQGRAAQVLRETTMRQKGGWLRKDLAAWAERLRRKR